MLWFAVFAIVFWGSSLFIFGWWFTRRIRLDGEFARARPGRSAAEEHAAISCARHNAAWPTFEGVGLDIARGAASVGEVQSPDEPGDMVSSAIKAPMKFDRTAYQRAYMRKWRAARKGKRDGS